MKGIILASGFATRLYHAIRSELHPPGNEFN
jgi:hypothetical protein